MTIMVEKTNTPEQFYNQKNNEVCQEEINMGDMTYTCDMPRGHVSPEHKSLHYHIDENGNTQRVAVVWMKVNK